MIKFFEGVLFRLVDTFIPGDKSYLNYQRNQYGRIKQSLNEKDVARAKVIVQKFLDSCREGKEKWAFDPLDRVPYFIDDFITIVATHGLMVQKLIDENKELRDTIEKINKVLNKKPQDALEIFDRKERK